jgi:hypothetical protein
MAVRLKDNFYFWWMEIHEKLDLILSHIIKSNEYSISFSDYGEWATKIISDKPYEIGMYFRKLESDGFIKYVHNTQMLILTIDGEIFINSGGYTAKHSETIRKAMIQENILVQQQTLALKTAQINTRGLRIQLIIAIGTSIAAVYYLTELWEFYQKWSCHCH